MEKIKADFATKDKFLTYQDSINCSGDRIIRGDGEDSAEIKL